MVWDLLPLHVFKLLVLAAESFMEINQVNSKIVSQHKIIMRGLTLCFYCASSQGEMLLLDKVRKVSFHNPHLPLPSLSSAKSLYSCTGMFGSNPAGQCTCALAATAERDSRRKETASLQVLVPCAQHTWQV
jgi:hypothetical protein